MIKKLVCGFVAATLAVAYSPSRQGRALQLQIPWVAHIACKCAFYSMLAVLFLCAEICISDEPEIQEQKPAVKEDPLTDKALTVDEIIAKEQEKIQEPVCSNTFIYPCEGYTKNLHKSNFGRYFAPPDGSRLVGTYHLAEDVWVKAGTPVKSIANGEVMYSDFCPTWKTSKGRIMWGFGNIIVINHKLENPKTDLKYICSVYIHLSNRRLVKTGNKVAAGQIIGYVGKDGSRENGNYPKAHLHFGIHKGHYFQVTPVYKRFIKEKAEKQGLAVRISNNARIWVKLRGRKGKWKIVKGKVIRIRHIRKDNVSILFEDKRAVEQSMYMNIICPGSRPKPLMFWCRGYDQHNETLKEWIKPSLFIKNHMSGASDIKGNTGEKPVIDNQNKGKE